MNLRKERFVLALSLRAQWEGTVSGVSGGYHGTYIQESRWSLVLSSLLHFYSALGSRPGHSIACFQGGHSHLKQPNLETRNSLSTFGEVCVLSDFWSCQIDKSTLLIAEGNKTPKWLVTYQHSYNLKIICKQSVFLRETQAFLIRLWVNKMRYTYIIEGILPKYGWFKC